MRIEMMEYQFHHIQMHLLILTSIYPNNIMIHNLFITQSLHSSLSTLHLFIKLFIHFSYNIMISNLTFNSLIMIDTQYIRKAYNLLKDAINPNNSYGIKLATDELINLIVANKMLTLDDYLAFKDDWYSKLKNQSY